MGNKLLKIAIDTLATQFSSNEWPGFLAVKQEENQVSVDLRVDGDIRWFEGHFPDQPVLAGVVQTHWAGEISRYVFSIAQDFVRIDKLKFQSVILPQCDVHLSLEYIVDSNAVKFQYTRAGQVCSEGKIVFSPE